MATDNIYPTGINATTGKPEVADTPYSSIAGDFVNVLAGGTSGGNAQTVIASNPASGVSLTVANSAVDGASVLSVGGTGVEASTGIQSYGTTFADSNYAGNAVFRGSPIATKTTRFQSADALDAAMPFEFHVGALSSTSKMFRIGIEGVDPITIAPTQLAANTNNWNPTGFAGAQIIYASADAARDLTGLTAPSTGSRQVTIVNLPAAAGGVGVITIKHNSGSSTAANRFYTSTLADIPLDLGAEITFTYNDALNIWFDNAMNLAGVAGTGVFVELDGGPAGEQTILNDQNGATNLIVDNPNAGVNATAGFAVTAENAELSAAAFSDAYTVAAYQNAVRLAASTGSNGFHIDNTGGNPIKLQVSGADVVIVENDTVTVGQTLDSDVALAVTNPNSGTAASSTVSTNAQSTAIAITSYSNAHATNPDANIIASTGATAGLTISDATLQAFKVGSTEYLGLRTTGVTAIAGTQTTTAMKVGGRYDSTSTQVGNVGAGEDTLWTTTVKGNTLTQNGQVLRFRAFGTIANTAATKEIRVRFGSGGTNLVFDSGADFANAATDWYLDGYIIRSGAATQKGGGMLITSVAGDEAKADNGLALDQTLSGDVTFLITGEATNNDDIVLESASLWFE